MIRAACLIGMILASAMSAPLPVRAAGESQAKPGAEKAAPAAASSRPAAGRAAARLRATTAAPVNVNAATVAQLQTLPGVGASTAQRIVDYRQKNGGFKKIEELMNVKGVGEKSFLKLKPFVVVSADRGGAGEAQK